MVCLPAYWALSNPVILSEAKDLAYWDSFQSRHSEALLKNLSLYDPDGTIFSGLRNRKILRN
jgi:hypothetical protein